MIKYTKKVRINVTMPPSVLTKIDRVAGPYQRSQFIARACFEKIARDEDAKDKEPRR